MKEDFLNFLSKAFGALVCIFFAFLLVLFILKDASAKEGFKNTVDAVIGVNADVSVCAFEKVDLAYPYDGNYLIAYRETVTDVLYLRYAAGYKGGLTVMHKPPPMVLQ